MPAKYIKYFPKPLLDDLLAGRWLPVVGAGMSLNAVTPPGKRMPLWKDLGDTLANDLTDFSPNSVLDAISAYEHEFGRAKLIERLSELLLLGEAQPGEVHKQFCTIPFDVVCTTNFDFLLERQYDLIPRYTNPLIDEEQLSINLAAPGTQLLKLHGDLRHPARLVVSEADYDGFLARFPLLATYLSNLLITRTAVFIGYSLEDPDFRQVLHVVDERLGRTRRMRYALAVNASPADVKRFERRNVQVINLPGSRTKYAEVLAAAFRELHEFIRDNLMSVSKVKEEEPLRELLLPRDATSRLCFCAIPIELQPFYRERVFPIIEDAGFVPVTADEIVSPGENIAAKIDALIDRAAVMIVEIGSSWTKSEFQMAVVKLKSDRQLAVTRAFNLLVVTSEHGYVPPSRGEYHIIRRLTPLDGGTDDFLNSLSAWLRNLAEQSVDWMTQEPRRLLQAHEYRPAVISALTLLEATLRLQLGKSLIVQDGRRLTLRSLIDKAQTQGAISNRQRQQIDEWVLLRNLAVHTPSPVTKSQAERVVRGVMEIVTKGGAA